MHGLINKAIETFVIETYGDAVWREVAEQAALGFVAFEAMLTYQPELTARTLDAVEDQLGRGKGAILEDIGTFLVTSPRLPAIRRLLRFGGVNYEDFLHSLPELPDRARLAIPDLHLPGLTLIEDGGAQFRLQCARGLDGFGDLLVGVLRAMSDDYGALATLEHHGRDAAGDVISIVIIQDAFSEGRSFELGARTA